MFQKKPNVELDSEEAELQRALAMSMVETTAGVGLSPSFDGRYELVGIVSHKGRSSNSGHYMGLVFHSSFPPLPRNARTFQCD